MVARSLKKKNHDGSTDSKQTISNLQGLFYIYYIKLSLIDSIIALPADDLLQMLSQERIERTIVRSQATFELDEYGDALIVVTRKMGKWNQFGFNSGQGFCLAEHETLFLIEMVISFLVILLYMYILLLCERMIGFF